jgi:hypothetical protein
MPIRCTFLSCLPAGRGYFLLLAQKKITLGLTTQENSGELLVIKN